MEFNLYTLWKSRISFMHIFNVMGLLQRSQANSIDCFIIFEVSLRLLLEVFITVSIITTSSTYFSGSLTKLPKYKEIASFGPL